MFDLYQQLLLYYWVCLLMTGTAGTSWSWTWWRWIVWRWVTATVWESWKHWWRFVTDVSNCQFWLDELFFISRL